MNRIIPRIITGDYNLLISETICFNPLDGLQIEIPTTSGQASDNIVFKFNFPFQEETKNSKVDTKITKNRIDITIFNFGSALISGLTSPLTFKIGNTPLSLFFTGMLLTNDSEDKKKLLQFTFSIFSGKEK